MGRPNLRSLTKELESLGAEPHTTRDDGTVLSRDEVLAEMIWRQALGWTEITRDENGNLVKKVHPPVARFQEFLYERREGKAPIAAPDNAGGMRASEKVSDLAKQRINQIAAIKAGPPKKK